MHKNLVVHHLVCEICRSLKTIPFFPSHLKFKFLGFRHTSHPAFLVNTHTTVFEIFGRLWSTPWPQICMPGAPQQKAGFWTSPNSDTYDVRCATFWKSWIFFPMGKRWVGYFTTPPNSQKRLAVFRCFFGGEMIFVSPGEVSNDMIQWGDWCPSQEFQPLELLQSDFWPKKSNFRLCSWAVFFLKHLECITPNLWNLPCWFHGFQWWEKGGIFSWPNFTTSTDDESSHLHKFLDAQKDSPFRITLR